MAKPHYPKQDRLRVRKHIKQAHRAGKGSYEIAILLNKSGWKTPGGHVWDARAVANHRYVMGIRMHKKNPKYKKRKTKTVQTKTVATPKDKPNIFDSIALLPESVMEILLLILKDTNLTRAKKTALLRCYFTE